MSVAKLAGLIAGGVGSDDNTRKIICGGSEKIVGENARWFMNDKFYELKYAADDTYSDSITDKKLLKIVDLKIPLNFNRKKFYDDSNINLPCKSETDADIDLHKKAILVLQNRLNEPLSSTIKRLTESYDLQHPLFWAMSQFVRYLAFAHKKHKKNKQRIKITHDLTLLVEQIWHGNNYFKYVINKPDAPSNIKELIFDGLEKVRALGKWKEPTLKPVQFPHLDEQAKKSLQDKILQEKEKLQKKKALKPIDETREYVFTILSIEMLLIDHLEKIEEYYIVQAENISSILKSVKDYFSTIH